MIYNAIFLEQWIEFGLGTAVFLLRIYSQLARVGWKKFQADDILIVLSVGLWTGVHVSVYILNTNTGFSAAPDLLIMDDAKYKSFVRGSTAVASAWITYTILIWFLKACWLFIFSKLTDKMKQQRLIKKFGITIVLAYIPVFTMIMLHCLPSTSNFHVQKLPDGLHQFIHGPQFVLWTVMNYIIIASMNCGTDILLLSIPLPLLLKVRISAGRKFVLLLFLCSGIFVIIAALLRCIESLGAVANTRNSTIWGIREQFVAICAVCAPAIKSHFFPFKAATDTGNGAVEKRKKSASSSPSSPSDTSETSETKVAQVGVSMIQEVGSRESLGSPPDSALHQAERELFSTTNLGSHASQDSHPPRSKFRSRMQLSVIDSETESRMSECSMDISTASIHCAPETMTMDVAEPLQVYIQHGSRLQQDIEAALPHIYRGKPDLGDGQKGQDSIPEHRGTGEGWVKKDILGEAERSEVLVSSDC